MSPPGRCIRCSIRPRSGDVIDAARRGTLRLLYVAPERFASSAFGQLLTDMAVARFVVDEAHCVSQWGHDFPRIGIADRHALVSAYATIRCSFACSYRTLGLTPEGRQAMRGGGAAEGGAAVAILSAATTLDV